jgi:sporulation protein YlmC with PRC-barrel domain
LVDVPFPKSSYGNGKITVYFDMINLIGNFMVVNELKNPYKE